MVLREVNRSIEAVNDAHVMCHHNQRLAIGVGLLKKQVQGSMLVGRIKISCRLVSKNEFWVGDQSTTDRDSLLLSLRCLLYTSPSPRDRQKSRMPSSA